VNPIAMMVTACDVFYYFLFDSGLGLLLLPTVTEHFVQNTHVQNSLKTIVFQVLIGISQGIVARGQGQQVLPRIYNKGVGAIHLRIFGFIVIVFED
jgi:hypothetical protein